MFEQEQNSGVKVLIEVVILFLSDVNECESNPCRNGGTCVNQWHRYSCMCQLGFTGYNCERSKCFNYMPEYLRIKCMAFITLL